MRTRWIEKYMAAAVITLMAVISPCEAHAQVLNVRLKNIRYYASTRCGDENPVLVKVCFSTSYKKPMDLDMVVKYSDAIVYTSKVSECDREGNIYYSFCCKDDESNSFDIYFRAPDGEQSRRFSIFAKPD